VLATGIVPRQPDITCGNVVGYIEAIAGARPLGKRVAVVGADIATELDAKRAIGQGAEVAAAL
jgi:hypothetical protein